MGYLPVLRVISCASGQRAQTSGSASWMAQWFPVRKGAVAALFLHRGQPQHRQAAHLPDALPTVALRHDAGRQAQPGGNAPQVKARQHDILPLPGVTGNVFPALHLGQTGRA